MTIQRHVIPARSDVWGNEPARGTAVIASDDCVTVMNGRLQTGVSKNGKAWQRWQNNERFFYSTKTGVLRVFHKTRKDLGRPMGGKVNRYQNLMRDITASAYMPYPLFRVGAQGELSEFLMSSLEVNITGFQRLSNFADSIHYAAFPILREAGWRPVQGIGSYGREAISGRSHLFALKRGSDLIANLEVTPTGQVRQFYGRFNKVPAETITVPVRKAIEKKLRGDL